jgi:hypothetical protein
MQSAASGPHEGRAPLSVGWTSTLMELRQYVNLLLASRGDWGFYPSHGSNRATSRTVIFARDDRMAGETVGDECRHACHSDALCYHH